MRPIHSVLLLLLLTGCASSSPKFETRTPQQIQKEKEAQDDHNFFYGGWLPKKSTPEKPEKSQFDQ